MKVRYLFIVTILLESINVQAKDGLGGHVASLGKTKSQSQPEIVKWIGEISDSASEHTTLHSHGLEFKNQETGKTYDIVDSPELVKLHHETEKNFTVEIEAEKTPRFLFWGGNLIVKTFKVINETALVPHTDPREPAPLGGKFRGGGTDH